MKLVRYGNEGREKPGVIDADGLLRDLSSHVADINGPALSKDSLKMLYDIDPASLPAVSGVPRARHRDTDGKQRKGSRSQQVCRARGATLDPQGEKSGEVGGPSNFAPRFAAASANSHQY